MLVQDSMLVCVARGNPKGDMQQDVVHVMACSTVAEVWCVFLKNWQVGGNQEQSSIEGMPVEKNVSEKAVYTSIAVMHNIHLTAECDLLLDRNCIFCVDTAKSVEIKYILDCPSQCMTSLIWDVLFSISAYEHNRGGSLQVFGLEKCSEKPQLQLWQQFLTIIYPGMVCWASCSREIAFFIAIKLHSFPPDSCLVWPQFPTNGCWAAFLAIFSAGL